ncbi:histone-like transcription factor (CBF/NF-Y) and archaeal histone domain containing protein, putative [Babesia bigemina]|uniref:Histone-like transcription factor (CBF/NF-Y) and archaeal histone domain containing protein, putative n=1 Tax=Babesia bigemina TaxID=5866 RepID=A0A061D914_BABBI|nr:histone-like transcription factor (CBF/NF-Y) and archaeal histone domain containing protein, putative [Babesia bigemina]CDR95379.1 histone-like transcription factor (CBF/NF-Y) and archaeal histone domain containing protein, putative [Babesia bigemina]|eukprot:XP_012767565.1 histone-like transcription factor (CBF/NF-Y) and archaeal histone domain containing protein, putative [Babesia bigemina]
MADYADFEHRGEHIGWQVGQNEHFVLDGSCLVGDVGSTNKGFHLPVARIKKIMKEGEHPGMIASDAPILLAKACEMLIRDLTLQSWYCTLTTRRCTLQRQDVAAAIFKNSIYNFMLDVFKPEELYPKLEPKTDNMIQYDAVMNVNDGIGYSISPNVTKPRDSYVQSHGAIVQTHNAIYQRGSNRYIPNQAAQGQMVNAPISQFIPCHGMPAINTMIHYSKSVPSSGHVMQNGHVAKIPMQVIHSAKSHAIIPGTLTYAEGSLLSEHPTNQTSQGQMPYVQHRYTAPQENITPRSYQQPY